MFENFVNFLNGKPVTQSSGNTNSANGNRNSLLKSQMNNDLTDKDIDRTHSSKTIDFMLENLQKMNILNDGQNQLEKSLTVNFRSENLLSVASQSESEKEKKNNSNAAKYHKSNYHYRLPNVMEKKSYLDSFGNANKHHLLNNPSRESMKTTPLTTLESEKADLKKIRERHHTQPRTHNRQQDFQSNFTASRKNLPHNYIAPLQPRMLSGSKIPASNITSLRREVQGGMYPTTASSDMQKYSKRSPQGLSKAGIHLQGFTIRPDAKFSSLTESNQKVNAQRNSYLVNQNRK